ncbi:hypothetical protein COV82_04455 [Candidatus Peregrinibacteria bacterium CG11_big_fil_rev_8_21_14_0_20_46_8]|nr:MAG: hypothetical protein COV82_04455 [Candidatus Peregrinibacteria bacterium CG11_big_fil_rev_8_21_14_0_20_46_8]
MDIRCSYRLFCIAFGGPQRFLCEQHFEKHSEPAAAEAAKEKPEQAAADDGSLEGWEAAGAKVAEYGNRAVRQANLEKRGGVEGVREKMIDRLASMLAHHNNIDHGTDRAEVAEKLGLGDLFENPQFHEQLDAAVRNGYDYLSAINTRDPQRIVILLIGDGSIPPGVPEPKEKRITLKLRAPMKEHLIQEDDAAFVTAVDKTNPDSTTQYLRDFEEVDNLDPEVIERREQQRRELLAEMMPEYHSRASQYASHAEDTEWKKDTVKFLADFVRKFENDFSPSSMREALVEDDGFYDFLARAVAGREDTDRLSTDEMVRVMAEYRRFTELFDEMYPEELQKSEKMKNTNSTGNSEIVLAEAKQMKDDDF